MEGIKKAMNERNLNEGQWEDRKQWSLGVGQRRKSFETYISIYILNSIPLEIRVFKSRLLKCIISSLHTL